jgi:NADH dehydrogenase
MKGPIMANTGKKHIVVLGGGFGGVVTVFELLKRIDTKSVMVTLVDKNDYHFYYPNTYEVATAEEDFSTLPELKATIAFPYKDVLPPGVLFMQGAVTAIDREAKTVTVNGQAIAFDYCVIAMGSETAYYGIAGLKDFALTMKSFPDAVKYRNAIEETVQRHSHEMIEAPIRIIVGGGGFTGVEIASETVNLLGIVAAKNGYNYDKFEVLVVDANPTILAGQPEEIVDAVVRRMKHLQVPIEFRNGFAVQTVYAKSITLTNGEIIDYDILVWTGGVQAVPVPFVQRDGVLDKRGRVIVDNLLRVVGMDGTHESSGIFALGDDAIILDASGKPIAQTAQQAVTQAEYLGAAIPALMRGKSPAPFVAVAQPFILPVCGKWAVVRFPGGFTMYGFIPWLMHNYATFRYLKRLMPTMAAIAHTWAGMKLYTKNDM